MKIADCYQILRLRSDASVAEVKASYRHLARQYHPDANPGDDRAHDKFIQLHQAYKQLLAALSSRSDRQASYPAQQTSANQTSANQTSTKQTSANQTSAKQTSANQTSANQTSANQTSAKQTSTKQTSTKQTSANNNSPRPSSPNRQKNASRTNESSKAASSPTASEGKSESKYEGRGEPKRESKHEGKPEPAKTSPFRHNPQLSELEKLLKQKAYRQLQELLKSKRFPRAIALVEGLARRVPNDAEIKQWQAITYQRWARHLLQQGQIAKARIYLKKALRTDPHNRSLWAEVERDFRRMESVV